MLRMFVREEIPPERLWFLINVDVHSEEFTGLDEYKCQNNNTRCSTSIVDFNNEKVFVCEAQ